MRKSLLLALIVAIGVIALDLEMYRDSQLRVSVSYVSAQEALPAFIATSTLIVPTGDVWNGVPEIAVHESDLAAPPIPAPSAAAAKTRTITPKRVAPPTAAVPLRLRIPSIGLDAPIDTMGLNAKGEMDVPDGISTHVGWYKGGPMPGQMGSAVIDAHVFAAFKDLRYLAVGADVFVETASGQVLRFVVDESLVFVLSELKPHMLFGRNDARRLTLITCAGSLVGDTYSHRLVVYTKFAEIL